MRILTVANDLVPFGGLERMQLEIHRTLARRGHPTALVHTRPGTLGAAWDECTVTRTRASTTVLRPRHPFATLSGARSMAHTVGGFRPDVIHLHHYRHLHLTAPVARRHGIPIVLHLHTAAPAGLGRLGRRLVALPRRVLAVSGHTATAWAPWRSDAVVVPNGIDLDAFRPADDAGRRTARALLGLGDDTFVVGFAGRVTAHKGVPVLLDAWRRLRWPADHAVLIVAGEGDAALLASAPEGVDARGFLDDPRPVYAAADVVVVPSTWPDPCPRAVLEAMAAGCTVVASRIGGIPELLPDDAGVLVDAGDSAALADALVRLRQEPEQREQLRRRARIRAQEAHDLDGCVDAVEAHLVAVTREDQ